MAELNFIRLLRHQGRGKLSGKTQTLLSNTALAKH